MMSKEDGGVSIMTNNEQHRNNTALSNNSFDKNNDDGVFYDDDDGVLRNTSIIEATGDAKTTTIVLSPVILCILGTETAERFAYFGFRAILVLYFVEALQYNETQAIALFAYNSSLAYFTPLVGATLADGVYGRYHTIVVFAGIYMTGLILLAMGAGEVLSNKLETKIYLSFAGLFLVCLGTGGIKPCVSAFGADQIHLQPSESDATYDDNDIDENGTVSSNGTASKSKQAISSINKEEQVRIFFSYFYVCINIGALTSIAIVPFIREYAGFGAAFAVPCACMGFAVILFLSKRTEYIHHCHNANDETTTTTNTSSNNTTMITLLIMVWIVQQRLATSSLHGYRLFQWLKPGRPMPSIPIHIPDNDDNGDSDDRIFQKQQDQQQQLVDDANQTLHCLPILAMLPIFWCLYDQQSSVWTLQATRMYVPWGMQPEQLNIINPLQIMIFVPLFDKVIYPYLQRQRIDISPVRRMMWGMVFSALSFFVSGVLESRIRNNDDDDDRINVFWQVPQITLLAIGEIFLSITGLEFAYATSPNRFKAVVTALFLCTTGIGDLFSGVLYSTIFVALNQDTVLYVCAVLMLCNLACFTVVANWYTGTTVSPSVDVHDGIPYNDDDGFNCPNSSCATTIYNRHKSYDDEVEMT